MGLIKKSTIESYWNVVHRSQDTPWFRAVMNRDRFQLLCKFIHFADNTQLPGVDEQQFKLFKLQPLINHFTKVFQRYYQPKQDISIDESMIGYKEKTPHLRQYMPNKHHSRFGIKLWCLCESDSGYTCHFEVYKGAADPRDGGAEGMTFNLCVRLLREANLLRLGYHLGLDNYFSSPKLFFHLFDKQTTATGTVRSNRKGRPDKSSQQSRQTSKHVSAEKAIYFASPTLTEQRGLFYCLLFVKVAFPTQSTKEMRLSENQEWLSNTTHPWEGLMFQMHASTGT